MRFDLITPSTRMQRALLKLQERWIETQARWDDRVSEQFQQRYLEPLLPKLQLTLSAMHQLTEVLHEADQQTSDPAVGDHQI